MTQGKYIAPKQVARIEVLRASGLTYKAIAVRMGLDSSTVARRSRKSERRKKERLGL